MKTLDKFNEYFEKRGAKRIRFKVDPTLKSGFSHAKTYEGYVLSENVDGEAVIYIPSGNEMGAHTFQNLQDIFPIPDRLEPIKKKIVELLNGKPGQEYIPQIINSDCFMEIEQYLKHAGYNDSDIIDLLKRVITNESTAFTRPTPMPNKTQSADYLLAKLATKAGRVASAATKPIRHPFKTIGKIGGALAKAKSKMDAATNYLKTFKGGEQGTKLPPLDINFLRWFDRKYKYKGDYNKIVNHLENTSESSLKYYEGKYYEQTAKHIKLT